MTTTEQQPSSGSWSSRTTPSPPTPTACTSTGSPVSPPSAGATPGGGPPALDRTPVDLLLLDLHLPDGHGLQLPARCGPPATHADVIAVTSARDLAVVREGVSLGVVQYVLKPFTFATLRDRLVRYAEFRAAAGEASGQDEVDRALGALRAPQPAAACRRGSAARRWRPSPGALRAAPDGADGVGGRGGAGHLADHRTPLSGAPGGGRARGTGPQYGQIGRPELYYRWVRGVVGRGR